MKKIIIIVTTALLVIILGTYGFMYVSSFQDVTFNISDEVSSINIYSKNNDELIYDGIPSNPIKLRSGEYYITPHGDKIDTSNIEFTLGKNNDQVKIDPDYSTKYLVELLKAEQVAARSTIAAQFSNQMSQYKFINDTLYKKGQWYGVVLKNRAYTNDNTLPSYRVVLRKQNDSWDAVTTPSIHLSAQKYPSIPIDILTDINQTTQE